MSIVRWNPSREFDEFFNRFANQRTSGSDENLARSDWSPSVDIRETDDDFQIDLELPAVPAADVKVTVKDGVLAVSGSLTLGSAASRAKEAGFTTNRNR